jgi:hypothetical protein
MTSTPTRHPGESLTRNCDMFSFPPAGKVATSALRRGSRMGVGDVSKHAKDKLLEDHRTPTPVLRTDPPRKGEGKTNEFLREVAPR